RGVRRSLAACGPNRFVNVGRGVGTRHKLLQLARILGSAALCAREDELPGMRLQNSYHLLILFVCHHTENDPYILRMKLFQERSERRSRRHIVSTIQEKASDLLQTAGPGCGVDAANNGGAANTKTLGGPDSSSDVFRLMAAKQAWIKIWISLEGFPCGHDQALPGPFANNR